MERKAQVGDLVFYADTTWRVRSISRYGEYSLLPTAMGGYCTAKENDLKILEAPPLQPPSDPTLHERYDLIRANTTTCYRKARELPCNRYNGIAETGFYALYHKLNGHHKPEHAWFWNNVATSFEAPSKVSYAANMEDVDNEAKRRFCSLKKFLSNPARKFGLELEDATIVAMCTIFGEYVPNSYKMHGEVVRGIEVYKTYRDGPSSCMKGKHYVKWYAENPDKVGILRILQGKTLVGRALVWTTDDGQTILDRVYPDGDAYKFAVQYASEQGWTIKRNMSQPYPKVTMKRSKSGKYPYMDTFRYTHNHPREDDEIVIHLESAPVNFGCTEGGWVGTPSTRHACVKCSEMFGEERLIRTNNGFCCSECIDKYFTYIYYRNRTHYVEGHYPKEAVAKCCNCSENRRLIHLTTLDDNQYCRRCHDDIVDNRLRKAIAEQTSGTRAMFITTRETTR